MESLAASLVFACERSLICMTAVMPNQSPTVMESLAARPVIASIRMLVRMPAVMGLKG